LFGVQWTTQASAAGQNEVLTPFCSAQSADGQWNAVVNVGTDVSDAQNVCSSFHGSGWNEKTTQS
jgi:hypothetical protein